MKLEIGDIIEINSSHTVYAWIPKHFVYSNRKGDFSLTKHNIKCEEEFEYLQGKYIVTYTCMDGGGTGMGPNDVFPDGHHIFCENVNDRSIKIDFYQSGCFNAMIENIEPVGKAKQIWVIDEGDES